jgi:hypothetical protein
MSNANVLNTSLSKRIYEISYDGLVDKHRVARENNFSVQTSERRLRTLKLRHTPQHLIDILKEFREGCSPKALAAKYGMSSTNVRVYLKRRGEKMRNTTYFSDFNFFDEINTEAKAYILGFIYADGCLHRNSLSISLALKDIEILERIKLEMRSERVITKMHNSGFGDGSLACNLTITSSVLREGLIKQGITERKTETCNFPEIPEAYLRHFIRGYVDGDGSFGLYHSKGVDRYNLSICASPLFATRLSEVFSGLTTAKGGLYKRHKDSKSNVVTLRYSGKTTVCVLLDYMYAGATIYLSRKQKNYLRIVHNKKGCKKPVTSKLQARRHR